MTTAVLNSDSQLALSERALVPLADEHLIVDEYALARIGSLAVTQTACERAFRKICRISAAVKYWRGDLMNLTETLFAEEASQIIDSEFLTEAEAKAEMFVAANVSPGTRTHAPSWEHARAVSKLPEPQQIEWLERATSGEWSAGKLKTELALAGNAKTFLQWMCVVDCGTEAKRDKVAERLEGEGYTVLRRDKVRKQPKPKKVKKGPVTAKGRGKGKMSSKRRAPQ